MNSTSIYGVEVAIMFLNTILLYFFNEVMDWLIYLFVLL